MNLPTTGTGWARWGLLAATLAMGGALVASSFLSYRSVVQASSVVARSLGEALLRSVFVLVRPDKAPVTSADLEALLGEHAAEGLRFVAVLDENGRTVAAAGVPLVSGEGVVAARGSGEPHVVREIGDRVQMVAGPPPPPPHADKDAGGHSSSRTRPTIVVEFEPVMARQLSARAARALSVGVVAAAGLMVVALLFSRQLARREAAERRLEEQRRLAVLGEMSSVIAHELRNPLASLKGHAQLLAEKLPEASRERSKADRIVLEAQRLETLSGDLLDFSRSGPVARRDVDPAALLRSVAESVDPSRVTLLLSDAPRRFALDPDRMRQALTNLLLNALEASPPGVPAEARVAAEGDALVFTIRDHGPGIPPGDAERIFEPFYTTRAKGTGLGLAVAQRIVHLHGGKVTAANDSSGGAVFRIVLPRG